METIKVLIADDIQILRQGLKAVLEQDEGIQVVTLAENGKEAFEKCAAYQPDGIRSIKDRHPNIKVLVLTTFDDEETIDKAVSSGADGYILKEMSDEKVIASVKSVHAGISVFGSGVYQTMRSRMEEGKASTGFSTLESDLEFTGRERDVIKLVAQGYDNKEIAAQLFLAEGTVRNQISKLLEKVELKDRTQLAIYAVKHGLD